MLKKAFYYISVISALLIYNNSNAYNTYSYEPSSVYTSSFDYYISPNPANDIIVLSFTEKLQASLFIYDGVGNEVIAKNLKNESSKTIPLNNLNAGIYFISVKTDTKTVIKRFIKY